VGAVIGINTLGIKKIYSSGLHIGSGFVQTAHGTLPVPAPATIELLKGIPVYSDGINAELTTPTGAAIVTYFSERFGDIPNMKINSIGYGAGKADLPIPNLLRLLIGEISDSDYSSDRIKVIETNIDDMNPEFYSYISERLFKSGALDVFTVPIMMKKSRPGIILNVLAKEDELDKILEIIFSETTTSGVRINNVDRKKLDREIKTLKIESWEIRVKINRYKNRIMTAAPEYEDCKRAASESGIPIKDIYDRAKAEAVRLFINP